MEKGIHLHKNVFFAPDIKRPEKHIAKLNKGKFIKKSYLVGFCNESNRLEIFLSYNFLQKVVREQAFCLIGLFFSEDEAFEFIRILSDLSFSKFNGFDPVRTVDELSPEDMEAINEGFKEVKE